uniref:Uncharacterized protein n=1 Tax=Anguilla anguilla TaxID=7936 RepID=A0A0E9WKS3_ANGAN
MVSYFILRCSFKSCCSITLRLFASRKSARSFLFMHFRTCNATLTAITFPQRSSILSTTSRTSKSSIRFSKYRE